MPKATRKPAASTWPPSLVSASSSKRSSSTPTAQISAPAISTIPASRNTNGELRREERQLAGHEVRRHEAAQHREPAEVGDRLVVHVAVADLRDRAGADRDLPGHDREQVGDRRGHQEDEDVLPHASASSAASASSSPSSSASSAGASGSGMAWPSGSSTALSWSRLMRAEPQHPAGGAGGVDDGRGRAARRRTGVHHHLDVLAQHLLGLGGLGRGRAAGQVGRADRERAGALEDLQGDRVVGHPHRDGAAGVAEVPLQRGVGVADQGQRAGPELLDQRPGPGRDPDRQRVEGGRRRDQDRRRHVAAAALGVEQLLDGVLVEGVGGQAVDGVGRQHHEASALDGQAGGLDRGLALLVGGGRVALPAHGSWCQSGGGEPRTAREVAVVAHLGPASGGGQHRRDRLALDVGVLDAEHSPGPEQLRRRGRPAPGSRRGRRRPRTAPGAGRGRGPRGRPTPRPRAGRTAGCRPRRRRCRARSSKAVTKSPEPQVDAGAGEVALRPSGTPARRAPRRAPGPAAPRRPPPWRSRRSRCRGRPRPAPRARRPPRSPSRPAARSPAGA